MTELAKVLLEPAERTEPPAPEPVNPKTGNPETGEQVFRKPALPKTSGRQSIEVHRPYGERGGYEKITVTLPSEIRGLLLEESLRRKKSRSPDWSIAAIVREAIAAYLGSKPKQ